MCPRPPAPRGSRRAGPLPLLLRCLGRVSDRALLRKRTQSGNTPFFPSTHTPVAEQPGGAILLAHAHHRNNPALLLPILFSMWRWGTPSLRLFLAAHPPVAPPRAAQTQPPLSLDIYRVCRCLAANHALFRHVDTVRRLTVCPCCSRVGFVRTVRTTLLLCFCCATARNLLRTYCEVFVAPRWTSYEVFVALLLLHIGTHIYGTPKATTSTLP